MTSHVYLIIGSRGKLLSNIMRDLKRHTSESLHLLIASHKKESRREWMLWMMERSAAKIKDAGKFRLGQPENHPVEIRTSATAHQKLNYIHANPVVSEFVKKP